jgi:hypothetical protein
MILATTTLINAQAVGGTPGTVQSVKTSANAGTKFFTVTAQITYGAGLYAPDQKIKFYYTSSPVDLTTTTGPISLRSGAPFITISNAGRSPGDIVAVSSDFEVLSGAYIYTWLETPTFSPTVTVSMFLVEQD